LSARRPDDAQAFKAKAFPTRSAANKSLKQAQSNWHNVSLDFTVDLSDMQRKVESAWLCLPDSAPTSS
jgi:hypothetical protein